MLPSEVSRVTCPVVLELLLEELFGDFEAFFYQLVDLRICWVDVSLATLSVHFDHFLRLLRRPVFERFLVLLVADG